MPTHAHFRHLPDARKGGSGVLPRLRPALVLFHRWVGLVMAGFLLIAGLTGSVRAWNDELEAAINPTLYGVAPPPDGTPPLDPLVLRERVLARYPGTAIRYVPLGVEPGQPWWFFLEARPDPATGNTRELANDQVFMNPYSGAVLGERKWGDITQGMKNLMPFLYRLHYSLALDVVGSYAFGIIALLWTLDCFVGAYLTFPARVRAAPGTAAKAGGAAWLTRWSAAWKVRWRGGSYKVHFDLHRAGGLWPWAMLLVLAWSSVAFNLSEVYSPVMRAVFAHQPAEESIPKRASPQWEPGVPWMAAREMGRTYMAAQAHQVGFTIQQEDALIYFPTHGLYRYDVRSNRDIRDHGGNTQVYFDANTGALQAAWLPTGAASGDTIRMWITSLHMAALWGVPLKVFICALGLAVAMLSVTGVVIWSKKRRARRQSAARQATASVAVDRWRPHGAPFGPRREPAESQAGK